MGKTSWHDASVPIDDWDILFSAVKARLRHVVGATLPHELNGATAPLQISVLECVDALDQLQDTLRLALAPSSEWRESHAGADAPDQAITASAPGSTAAAPP